MAEYKLSYTANEINTKLGNIDNKIDKVDGKGLSTNDLTNNLKTNYDAAYEHSTSAHAPVDAQANIVETIKVNSTALTVTNKAVDITVPTGALSNKDKVSESDLDNILATKINNKTDTSTFEAAIEILESADNTIATVAATDATTKANAAESNAKDYADSLNKETLEYVGTIPNGEDGNAIATSIIAYVDKKTEGIATDGAQKNIQSDWNQTDESQTDYIKNKPKIGGVFTTSVANNVLMLEQTGALYATTIENNILTLI